MTNMSYLILTPSRTLKDIFMEKIHGTDKFLVTVTERRTHFLQSEWLKWLIYIAAFKDHCNVDHVAFLGCNKADPFLKPAMEGGFSTPRLMPAFAWYADFKPSKSCCPAADQRWVLLMVARTSLQTSMIFC